MIEILQFGLGSNLGGIESYMKKIWDNIDREKYHYSFVDMTGDGEIPCYYEYFKQTGCNFYKITPRNVSIIQNIKDFNDLFEGHRFDIFHFSVNTLSYMLPVSIALKHNVKVLVHSRCSTCPGGRITKVLHVINRIRLKYMPVERIAISQQAGEWLFKDSAYKLYPNGVDTVRFSFSEEHRKNIRNEFKCGDKTVIGHVGTFIPIKNHNFLVKVFKEYHRRHANSVLWLVGEGPNLKHIYEVVKENGLEDSVLFLGRRNDIDVVYAGMDMFLFPSIYEGLGNVVLEAEAEGLPCLISNSIPQEILVAQNTKSLSLSDSPEIWCDTIDDLLNITYNRKQGCELIEHRGWSTIEEIDRLQELYQSMQNNKLA